MLIKKIKNFLSYSLLRNFTDRHSRLMLRNIETGGVNYVL